MLPCGPIFLFPDESVDKTSGRLMHRMEDTIDSLHYHLPQHQGKHKEVAYFIGDLGQGSRRH